MLYLQTTYIACNAELALPGGGVRTNRALEEVSLLLREDGQHEIDEPANCSAHRGGFRRRRGRPVRQPDEIVGPAGLGARPDGRFLPAAERLSTHNRTGDGAVDVEVAGLGPVEPEGNLVPVKRVQPRRQPVVDLVLHLYRLGKVLGGHQPKDWAEVLG